MIEDGGESCQAREMGSSKVHAVPSCAHMATRRRSTRTTWFYRTKSRHLSRVNIRVVDGNGGRSQVVGSSYETNSATLRHTYSKRGVYKAGFNSTARISKPTGWPATGLQNAPDSNYNLREKVD